MKRNENGLLLNELDKWLEIFNITSATITHTWNIKEANLIYDILAIDETHILIAVSSGLLKANNQ
jgi:hypothetical protein